MTDRPARRPRPRLRGGRLCRRFALRDLCPPSEPQEPPDPARDEALVAFYASENEAPPPDEERH